MTGKWAVALMVAALAGCVGGGDAEPDAADNPSQDEPELPEQNVTMEPEPVVAPLPPPGIRFVAIGDQGTGKEDQYKVARAIEQVCAERGCDFAITGGDNIYETGTDDEYDPQFDTKFEQPYANLSFPFYLTLGNHDNSRDPATSLWGDDPATGALSDVVDEEPGDLGIGHWYETGNHQVAYTYRDDRASDKWNMPARYYPVVKPNVTFLALDTNTLMYYGQGWGETDITYQQQEAWVDETLAAVNTTWTIAFGHHPYLSNGAHGNAGNYEGAGPTPVAGPYVKEFYETHLCDKVDLVITGHDHDLQWLKPVESCGKTEFIVSGAAAKIRALADPERNEVHFQKGEVLGFVWIEIVGDALTGVFYDDRANVLYERTMERQG